MDNDLDRSVRLLEGALVTHRRSLLKPSTPKISRDKPQTQLFSDLDDNVSMFSTTLTSVIGRSQSITGSIIRNIEPWQNAVDSLYVEFLEIQHGSASGQDILEVVSDFTRCCSDTLKVVDELKSKVAVSEVSSNWLEIECNTWRLLYVLYHDRLNNSKIEDQLQYFGTSEKLCVLQLFKREALIRESQLVIDWLEYSAAERDDEVLHFSDSTVGWENTLHQLHSAETIVFESSRKTVDRLDPDAPNYQKLPLHDLDMSDEKRLVQKLFKEIRCGKFEEARKLCISCGHSWRAALLEGWRLFHDPNAESDNVLEEMKMVMDHEGSGESESFSNCICVETEGNVHRDIWKKMALVYCENDYLNIYERAAVAAYCGDLKTLLQVCVDWEDSLWAYLKVMVDIRVESEIRDCVNRKYSDLPESYWEQRMSLNEVFAHLESSENNKVQMEARNPERIIQKHIILDEIPQLLESLAEWIEESWANTQFMRFCTHLVLFLDHIGQAQRRDIVEKVVETYVKQLMEMNETQIVAFYVGKLGTEQHIHLYASYIERITAPEERREALRFAEDSNLSVYDITKQVVENIRNRQHETNICGDLQSKVTTEDEFKISALDWLLFYDTQRLEAMMQTNALIFTFLSLRKLDAARLAFNKIPVDSVEEVLSTGDVSSQSNIIKEYLSYKAYLDAHEAFNVWFKQFSSKPLPPEDVPENAQFTEKVAYEHRVSQFRAETERWKLTMGHCSKMAKAKLYNVLLFPDGGWLVGTDGAEFLRSICIPEIVLLLYSVLYESGMHAECVQLADILASEKYNLFKVYTKEKLGEILVKLCESSVALLNEKKDPWGNEVAS